MDLFFFTFLLFIQSDRYFLALVAEGVEKNMENDFEPGIKTTFFF